MRDGSVTFLRVRGIPIRAHWSLLLALPYLAWMLSMQFAMFATLAGEDPEGIRLPPFFWGLILAVGLFASVLLHELAHSLVAARAGGRVREITLLLLGGMSRIERLPRRPLHEGVIAAVGPLASLLVCGLLLLAHRALPWASGDVRMGLFYLAYLNLTLGLFNLLPAFPLDGGRVLRAALAARLGFARATAIASAVGRAGAAVLGALGLVMGNWILVLIAIVLYTSAWSEGHREKKRQALGDRRVAEVMMTPPPVVDAEARLAEVPALMRAAGRLDLVVRDGAQVIGVVRASDLAAAPPEARATLRVRDLGDRIAGHVEPARPDEPAVQALERAEASEADTLLVVDAGDGVVGLLGPEDLEHALVLDAVERRGGRGRWPAARPREA